MSSVDMNSITDEQKKIKQILDSVVESDILPVKQNEKNNNNKSKQNLIDGNKTLKNGKLFDNNAPIAYFSKDYKKQNSIHSKSSEIDDDYYLENVLNAKDRRASWSQVRSQRSYIPSLTAICKFIF